MKMLPRLYATAQGEPFRTEDYKGNKVEFFYLDDQKDYGKYVSRGRFSVWTSDGVNYRLFVDKGYYAVVPDLYRNDVNDIWLDFTNLIYGAQKKMSNRYLWSSFGVMAVAFIAYFIVQQLFPDFAQNFFLIAMVLLFIGMFFVSNIQQKKLKVMLEKENQEASAKIRQTLGEERFQNILNSQEKYYQEYFKVEEEPVDEPAEIETESTDVVDAEFEESKDDEDVTLEDKHE